MAYCLESVEYFKHFESRIKFFRQVQVVFPVLAAFICRISWCHIHLLRIAVSQNKGLFDTSFHIVTTHFDILILNDLLAENCIQMLSAIQVKVFLIVAWLKI